MTDSSVSERALHDHASQVLRSHEALLRDGRRNRAFRAALRRHVTPESSVLDIGAGTGIWAITAARLGARRVVAIELDPMLQGLIKVLADRNGVGSRVQVVIGDSRALSLPREFDVIVSETIGNTGFEEDLVSIMADARERYGRPGASLIPTELALLAAPIDGGRRRAHLPAGTSLDFQDLERLLPHAVRASSAAKPVRLLAEPAPLSRVDLTRATADATPGELTARWRLPEAGRLAGFALWADVLLSPGIRLDTRRTSSWSPTLLAVAPFGHVEEGGEVELQVCLEGSAVRWNVSLSSSAGRQTQALSPAIASTTLLLWATGRPLAPGHPGTRP